MNIPDEWRHENRRKRQETLVDRQRTIKPGEKIRFVVFKLASQENVHAGIHPFEPYTADLATTNVIPLGDASLCASTRRTLRCVSRRKKLAADVFCFDGIGATKARLRFIHARLNQRAEVFASSNFRSKLEQVLESNRFSRDRRASNVVISSSPSNCTFAAR